MAYSCPKIHTDACKSVRAGSIFDEGNVHVNHLVHWPRPHGKQKVDLVEERAIAGEVEDHQENQGD